MNKLFRSHKNNITPELNPVEDTTKKNVVIVGVLITSRKKGRHPLPVGKDSLIKREMISSANAMGIFMYFFYPNGFNLRKHSVSGHTYISTKKNRGHWVRGVFPLPNIVYNRISYRKNEAQTNVQKLLAEIENNPSIHIFNSRFLDKWEVHNVLSQNSCTTNLVPETVIFNRQNLYMMLDKYQELFIKPISNSIGKGIIKVQQKKPKQPILFKIAASNRGWNKCNSIKKLYMDLKAEVMGRKCLIQQGIDLATTGKRVFDLRTEVQKNDQGKWVFTGVGVRVAAPGKYVTHVPNGGSRAEYTKVIKKVFGTTTSINEKLEQQLANITSTVPRVLEKNLGINLGILSIDIGIDKNGLMQVIEVNSKPSSFDESDIRNKHLENLNKYFIYLNSLIND